MMKIIFNADDFGITDAVSAAIVGLFRDNTPLKSTTVMANLLSKRSAALLRDFLSGSKPGEFSVGLHFNLTCGRPLSGAAGPLTGTDGRFLKFGELVELAAKGELKEEQIAAEFDAQIEAFRAALGFYPSHCDSHKHMHMLPAVFCAVERGLKKFGVRRMRLTENISAEELFISQGIKAETAAKCFEGRLERTGGSYSYARSTALIYPAAFLGTYTVGALGPETFEKEIAGFAGSDGVYEYMTHPGACDDELKKLSGLLGPRESEARALRSAGLRQALEKHGIAPVSFHALQ